MCELKFGEFFLYIVFVFGLYIFLRVVIIIFFCYLFICSWCVVNFNFIYRFFIGIVIFIV